jgi:hypothetical protein
VGHRWKVGISKELSRWIDEEKRKDKGVKKGLWGDMRST